MKIDEIDERIIFDSPRQEVETSSSTVNSENLGIEAEVSDEENIDNDIISEFEAGISYHKISGIKLNFAKPNMKTLLENNEANC
ncbi:hypothetical protein TNCV_4095871 [Trichonephila clavipes]|nr:hypothetical protein TNCV_4095871 [Trichonephila clavipes]